MKRSRFFGFRNRSTITNSSDPTEGLPTNGGRSSIPESAQSTQDDILSMLNIADKNEYKEYIEAIEHLCKFNGDFGHALDNITSLANTPYQIYFDDNVSDEQAEEMIQEIKACEKTWYNYSEGLYSLIGDLTAQAVISGAISAEVIPTNNLDGVKKAVLVNPKDIVFKYDKKQDSYKPYQQVKGLLVGNIMNLNELNTLTYKYYATRRFGENPLAIPPLLTALENTAIEKDMLCSLKNMTKNLGVLGFLSILVNAPKKMPNETPEQFQAKCATYLNSVVPEVEKGMASGYVVGFKDSHEFDMQSTTQNVEGARKLFDLNTEMKHSGLKQDPLLLGRNFSTTETLGRVLLAKLTQKLGTYQKTVASFLEDIFKMHLMLKGFDFEYVEVEFEKAMVGDKLRDAEAEEKNIANADSKYKQGVISQQQRAQELGYEEPDEEEPRQSVDESLAVAAAAANDNNSNGSGNPSPGTDPDGDED